MLYEVITLLVEERPRLLVGHQPGQLVGRQPHVVRHQYRAELARREQRVDELDAVARQEGDAVALRDAPLLV